MKYRNTKVSYDNHSFASKLEASVYTILKSDENAGKIVHIQAQDHVLICGPQGHDCNHQYKIEYIADFKCTRPDGSIYHVESKGFANDKWPLKRRLWMHYGPNELHIYKGTHVRPYLDEVITPK